MKTAIRPIKYYSISIITFILLILNVYAAKALIIFGSPVLFAAALLLEVILIGLFIYSLLRLLTVPKTIVRSLVLSIWGGLATNDYVKKIGKSKSPIVVWFRRRLKTDSPYGLPLTITLLVASFFLINFISVMLNVLSKGSFTHVDIRVLNLIPSIRTPIQTSFFRAITTLANTETAILLIVTTSAILWRKHQKLLAGLVIFVATGEESITFVIKQLVHRMRPDQALRLIGENSYSFPSGHVSRATVLFGLLAYLIYKSYTSTRARLLTAASYVLAVSLVALSRVYLGVHYPSDVWGSILLGSALLALVIGTLEISSRYRLIGDKRLELSNRTILVLPAVLTVFVVTTSSFIVHLQPVMTTPAYITVQRVDDSTINKLPLYSETLTGSRMEPINFIYVGYEDQIVSIFESHAWYKADASTLSNTLKAVAVGFQGRQYITAPVTPSYLNSKPENLAFEQSTQTHSLRQRHHTRLWRTEYALADGRPIWVATASFDEGIEFAGAAKLPTHHIDPNIDAERAYITKSLGLETNLVTVVQPQLGKNASGDGFFTDGKAELIIF